VTRLQRRRLNDALAAIVAAGGERMTLPGHLCDRLARAMRTGSDGQWHVSDVLAQGRAWASLVLEGQDPKKCAKARDAIGLLWAAMEDEGP
jgi:hypothetical protein